MKQPISASSLPIKVDKGGIHQPQKGEGATAPQALQESHLLYKNEKRDLRGKMSQIQKEFHRAITTTTTATGSVSTAAGGRGKGGSAEKGTTKAKKSRIEEGKGGGTTTRPMTRLTAGGAVVMYRDPSGPSPYGKLLPTPTSAGAGGSRASAARTAALGNPKEGRRPGGMDYAPYRVSSGGSGRKPGGGGRAGSAGERHNMKGARGGGEGIRAGSRVGGETKGERARGVRRSPTREHSSSSQPRHGPLMERDEVGKWEEDGENSNQLSLPSLLGSRRSNCKALMATAAGEGGRGGTRKGDVDHSSGMRMGDYANPNCNYNNADGGDDGLLLSAEQVSFYEAGEKRMEMEYNAPHPQPTYSSLASPQYVAKLHSRIQQLDQQLGESRRALHDALITVDQLRRENEALRSIQQELAGREFHLGSSPWREGEHQQEVNQGGANISRGNGSSSSSTENADQTKTNGHSNNLSPLSTEGGTPSSASAAGGAASSMELARLTAENTLLDEQKRLLRAEVERLQQAQQQSWETSQEQMMAMSLQLQTVQQTAEKKEEYFHSAQSAWMREKEELERECRALRQKCRSAEGEERKAETMRMMPPSSSSAWTTESGGGGKMPPPLPPALQDEIPINFSFLQEMKKQQEEIAKSSFHQERKQWEEEMSRLRRELQEAQHALMQGSQEKYALQRYTARVEQLEKDLQQKISEAGSMEEQLLQTLGALQSCQRDATEAVRQEVQQEVRQLRQELEEAHEARRAKEKLTWELREQLGEATRKAQQSAADVEMYKNMMEKYYAGVLEDISHSPPSSSHRTSANGHGTETSTRLHGGGGGSGMAKHGPTSSPTNPLPFSPSSSASPPGTGGTSGGGGNITGSIGLTSDELHRAYAVAALQKSSRMSSTIPWGSAATASSPPKSKDEGTLALSGAAAAPLQLFEALHWDEKWEAKQLREALATSALDLELAVQQLQQEQTQTEHYREQLAQMTKERDTLLEENMEMRRRLQHVQTVFAKQQLEAYRTALHQRSSRSGMRSPGIAYALGQGTRDGAAAGGGAGGRGEGKSKNEMGRDREEDLLLLQNPSSQSLGQIRIFLRSVLLEDAVLPLLGLESSSRHRSSPTSLFITLDGLSGYSTMLSPTFYSVEEGISDVLFQYDGLSPDVVTVEELQCTTLILQLHHTLKAVKDPTRCEDGEDEEAMMMVIESGSEIIAQAELPGTWLVQASEMTQEATLELISGNGDVIGHILVEYTCQRLMLPITLGFPLSASAAVGERGGKALPPFALGVDHGLLLSAAEVKAALVALRSVLGIRIEVFRLDDIVAQVAGPPSSSFTAPPALEKHSKDVDNLDNNTTSSNMKDRSSGRKVGQPREVSPYVFYTTNSPFPTVSGIRDTVVRPTVVYRRNPEEGAGGAALVSSSSSSPPSSTPLLSAVFETSSVDHRVSVDKDLIHFLCYSSISFVVFDEHEEDISRQIGMVEFPLRPLLDSPQAVMREEGILHPRGKLTVGISWHTM